MTVDSDQSDSTSRSFDSTLYEAAMILHKQLAAAPGLATWPPSVEDICEDVVSDMIPSQLKKFLSWTILGDDNLADESTSRRIFAIGQDLMYTASRGHTMTPKHVALANALHHNGSSKDLLTMINRFGHCISHDQVLRINTAVCNQIQDAGDDVIIPAGIQPGTFTQIAADNNDLLEATLDGRDTTHCTNMVVIQRQNKDTPQGQFGNHNVKDRRQRSCRPAALKVKSHMPLTKRMNPRETGFILPRLKPLSGFMVPAQLDAIWLLSRIAPEKLFVLDVERDASHQHGQCVPSWTGFNATATNTNPAEKSVIGYCPVIKASPTNYDAVYTLMDIACRMTKKIGQSHTVLVLDQAIYCKALEISVQRSDEFSHLILRLGGFHICTAFIAVIGKRMESSGLEDILIESGVYAAGSVPAIMNGKSYNRAVRAHKLMTKALNRLLIMKMNFKEEDEADIKSLVTNIRSDFSSTPDQVPCRVEQFMEKSVTVIEEKERLLNEGKDKSQLFRFWAEYLEMVDILLAFIRAERTGDWELHKASLAEMIPYFFAFDRQNYSRYASIYLAQMDALPSVAPEIEEHFQAGESVHRKK